MWGRMRYVLKHSGVCSGKKTPTFCVLFLIQGNLWAGELWDLLLCARERHCRKEHLWGFFYRKRFSCPCVLWSSSYPCCITPVLLTWGNWASSLAFWPALILPCRFARRCSLLSGALAQQPQRALALCRPHCITLLAIAALRALHGAILSACALCYNCACSQLHCFAGDDNT